MAVSSVLSRVRSPDLESTGFTSCGAHDVCGLIVIRYWIAMEVWNLLVVPVADSRPVVWLPSGRRHLGGDDPAVLADLAVLAEPGTFEGREHTW